MIFRVRLVSARSLSITAVNKRSFAGIIANVGEGGNEQDITLVENLAKSFIDRSNCIILLVISCESKCSLIRTSSHQRLMPPFPSPADFENQGAGRLVLRNPELKKRTVGMVLANQTLRFNVDHRDTPRRRPHQG